MVWAWWLRAAKPRQLVFSVRHPGVCTTPKPAYGPQKKGLESNDLLKRLRLREQQAAHHLFQQGPD